MLFPEKKKDMDPGLILATTPGRAGCLIRELYLVLPRHGKFAYFDTIVPSLPAHASCGCNGKKRASALRYPAHARPRQWLRKSTELPLTATRPPSPTGQVRTIASTRVCLAPILWSARRCSQDRKARSRADCAHHTNAPELASRVLTVNARRRCNEAGRHDLQMDG